MSSATEPTNATVTPREPILICDDHSPDAVRAIEAAAALLGPRRMKKFFDAIVPQPVAEHAGRPVLIVPPPR